MQEQLRQTLNKLRRINQRGHVRRIRYADKRRFMQLQVEGGQVLSDIEHLEPFGFTSHPLPGAQGIALAFKGNGSHTVVFCVGDQRYRLQIEEGEVAIYNMHGDKVHIKNDRTIDIDADVQVNLNTPEVHCSGNLTAAGTITGQVIRNTNNVTLGGHDHDENNIDGGTTDGANPS